MICSNHSMHMFKYFLTSVSLSIHLSLSSVLHLFRPCKVPEASYCANERHCSELFSLWWKCTWFLLPENCVDIRQIHDENIKANQSIHCMKIYVAEMLDDTAASQMQRQQSINTLMHDEGVVRWKPCIYNFCFHAFKWSEEIPPSSKDGGNFFQLPRAHKILSKPCG